MEQRADELSLAERVARLERMSDGGGLRELLDRHLRVISAAVARAETKDLRMVHPDAVPVLSQTIWHLDR